MQNATHFIEVFKSDITGDVMQSKMPFPIKQLEISKLATKAVSCTTTFIFKLKPLEKKC